MNGNVEIATVLGADLSKEIIALMIENRIREYGENKKDFEGKERESTFFFLKQDGQIKAFALLKPVILYYQGREYPIMGLANVMALEKGKGYGTEIMHAVTDYLEKNKQATIGNTWKYNFDFYKKCGYTFIQTLIERMTYENPNDGREKTERQDYDMFVYDPVHALEEILAGEEEIVIRVPFW